ncbi:hypothetical protein HYV12_00470 [Candidatus Dojkabacteria bacterium]|nr:hypothetical protein [Candidatus Dojkabacteria bacterium]
MRKNVLFVICSALLVFALVACSGGSPGPTTTAEEILTEVPATQTPEVQDSVIWSQTTSRVELSVVIVTEVDKPIYTCLRSRHDFIASITNGKDTQIEEVALEAFCIGENTLSTTFGEALEDSLHITVVQDADSFYASWDTSVEVSVEVFLNEESISKESYIGNSISYEMSTPTPAPTVP